MCLTAHIESGNTKKSQTVNPKNLMQNTRIKEMEWKKREGCGKEGEGEDNLAFSLHIYPTLEGFGSLKRVGI